MSVGEAAALLKRAVLPPRVFVAFMNITKPPYVQTAQHRFRVVMTVLGKSANWLAEECGKGRAEGGYGAPMHVAESACGLRRCSPYLEQRLTDVLGADALAFIRGELDTLKVPMSGRSVTLAVTDEKAELLS